MIHFLVVRVQFRNVLSLLKFNFQFMDCIRFLYRMYIYIDSYVCICYCRRRSSHGTSIKNINFSFAPNLHLHLPSSPLRTPTQKAILGVYAPLSLSLLFFSSSLFYLFVCVLVCVCAGQTRSQRRVQQVQQQQLNAMLIGRPPTCLISPRFPSTDSTAQRLASSL